MALCPSYLHHRIPSGFKVSTQPGFLTSEGALLYSRNATDEHHLRAVDGSTPIHKAAWEGQLIVPVWRSHQGRLLVFLSILMGWLYLDLPQYITPTPGISPSIIFLRLLDRFFGTTVANETLEVNTSGKVSQWIFFALHFLKVVIIWSIISFGAINPISFNPMERRRQKPLKEEELLSLGWTGARRVTPLEWREDNRTHQIASSGGIAVAFNNGVLQELGNAGVYLGHGEGWSTPLGNKVTTNEEDKVLLSDDYYQTLFQGISAALHNPELSTEEKNALLKAFRRSGPVDGPPSLQQIYKVRKSRGHGTVKKGRYRWVEKSVEEAMNGVTEEKVPANEEKVPANEEKVPTAAKE